jgi:hypothetical protein
LADGNRVPGERSEKKLWIAIPAAHARTEAAINTTSGITVDFADFAIAIPRETEA